MNQENRGLKHPAGSHPSLDETDRIKEEVHLHTEEEEKMATSSSSSELALEAELEQLRQELDKCKTLAEQHREMHLRALADLENYRRRARKEKEDALKYAVVPLLEALLPVLDNFERALDAADQTGNAAVLQEGIEMVYRQFLNVLSQSGLTMIEAEGKPFDPHEHNAVMQVETDKVESGIVVEELQAGYRYMDRVIRPSMVKVSK